MYLYKAMNFLNHLGLPQTLAVQAHEFHCAQRGLSLAATANLVVWMLPLFCFLSISIILNPVLSALASSWFTWEFTKLASTIAHDPANRMFKPRVYVAGLVTFDFLFLGSCWRGSSTCKSSCQLAPVPHLSSF